MIINELHIAAFGGLIDRVISLDKGLNVIEGENESGKTSAAMFIKFMFYGLSGKSTGGALSERKRYVNFTKSMAAGHLLLTENGVKYRIERSLAVLGDAEGSVRETVRIVNLSDGSIINGAVPGEYFFGVKESVFVNTVFVGQLANIRPDGDGLGGAVENMLSSADENVNLKKAVERLNGARRELQHKNGSGGEISALMEERSALTEEVQNASVSAEEIITLEATLNDARGKKAQLEKRKGQLDGVFKALDTILLKKKLDAVRQTEEKIARLTESVEIIDRSGFLTNYAEPLAAAERDIRAYEETKAFYQEQQTFSAAAQQPSKKRNDQPPAENADPVVVTALEEVNYLDTKSRIQFAVAIAMMVGGVAGLAAAFAMFYFNTGTYVLPLIMTAVFVGLGILFFLFQNRTLQAMYGILDDWKVETVEDLEILALSAGSASVPQELPELPEDTDLYGTAMENLREKRDEGEGIISGMAEGIGVEVQDDPLATASAIRDYAEKLAADRENRKAKIENFSGRLSVLKEQISSVKAEEVEAQATEVAKTPFGKLALSLDTEGIKKAIRERDFTAGALKSQVQRVEELEKQLNELKARAKSPSEAATRVAEIDELLSELELKRDAYLLAAEALKKAGENMRSGVIPKLTAYASDIMSEAVNGRYDALLLDSNFSMNYMNGSETRPVEYMSKGTYDAAYISLRLALMRVVFRNAMPPVVLDESFAYIDEERFLALLRCVSRSDGQSIFFTCRERETVAAHRGEIGANIITLKR